MLEAGLGVVGEDGDECSATVSTLRTRRFSKETPFGSRYRAVAHSMAFGPDVGLTLLDEIEGIEALRNYAPLPAARGDFLFRAGRLEEARAQFEAAAGLTRNAGEKAFLLSRANACTA